MTINTMQYGIAQAKSRLSELTHLVDMGQEVVIAKHGRPSYRLVLASAAPGLAATQASAGHAPTDLGDMADFLSQMQGKTRLPATTDSFVAQWRQDARY